MEQSGRWNSRLTFILAAVGSAVGLGNAWRFPGLMAAHGGGAFLFAYLIALVVMGIPLLMMEIAIGRKVHGGALRGLASLNKYNKPVAWAATANAFLIVTYYAIVFAWVLMMAGNSFRFAGMTGDTEAASSLFFDLIETTGDTTGWSQWPIMVIAFGVLAWGLIYFCIRDGANSVGKVVKYTVFGPIVLMIIMAIKGFTMPNTGAAMSKLFIPEWSKLLDTGLWVDAVGQVFYSLSVVMAIMFAYGSYLDDKTNIAVDSVIIALSDLFCSILSSIVMYTTMGGVGMLDDMSTSGVATAFKIYPQAIVSLTGSGVFNAIFGFIFYLCLVTLAIDSAFSIIEGVSVSLSTYFGWKQKKVTIIVCSACAVISLIYMNGAGLAVLDIVDHYLNQINMILIGVLECIAVAWMFDSKKVLVEVNKNTNKFKAPKWWFVTSLKFVTPILLGGLFVINMYELISAGGIYGAADGYSVWANALFGWGFSILVLGSGIVAGLVLRRRDKKVVIPSWDELDKMTDEEKNAPTLISRSTGEPVQK
ncbi:MAG TPA: hypothetical protein DCR12_04100 [Lachnospiraceae bacterium]|nr:hypothetical protein [Lachnospiraceae bacterium]